MISSELRAFHFAARKTPLPLGDTGNRREKLDCFAKRALFHRAHKLDAISATVA
jgi:hypothetical protein